MRTGRPRRRIIVLVLFLVAVMLPSLAGAGTYADSVVPLVDHPVVEARASADVVGVDGAPAGEITVAGQVVMRIRAAMGGWTSVQRAGVVAGRLRDLLQGGFTATSVAPGFMNGEVVVAAKEGLIVTIDPGTAQGNSTSRLELAVAWANNLRQVLGVPGLPWHETLLATMEHYKDATVIKGMASCYGRAFAGSKTSSDEVFNPNDFTAAHRTLPFGTRLLVINPANGQTVVVRVNDRGPNVRGRVLDLSLAAARVLGIVGQGVAYVEAYVLP